MRKVRERRIERSGSPDGQAEKPDESQRADDEAGVAPRSLLLALRRLVQLLHTPLASPGRHSCGRLLALAGGGVWTREQWTAAPPGRLCLRLAGSHPRRGFSWDRRLSTLQSVGRAAGFRNQGAREASWAVGAETELFTQARQREERRDVQSAKPR